METPYTDKLGSELERHARWLQRLALNLVDEEQAALDLAQETMLVALERPPSDLSRLRPWLARVLRNRLSDRWRGEARRRVRETDRAQSESQPDSTNAVERLELEQHLLDAVRNLDEPYRGAVVARFLEGVSPAVYAEREGIPGGTARWRINEGLIRLRAGLDDTFEGRSQWTILYLPFAGIRRGAGASAGTLFGVWTMKTILGSVAGVLALGLVYLASGALLGGPVEPGREDQVELASGTSIDGEAGLDGEGVVAVDTRAPVAAPPEVAKEDERALASFARLQLRVVDELGLPLSGATLRSEALQEQLLAKSDAAGRIDVEFEDTSEGRSLDFVLESEGRARAKLRRAVQDGELNFGSIALLPSAHIFGRVVDGDDQPLADVRVTARLGVSFLSSERLESTKTNELGEFTFESLPHGFLSFSAAVGPQSLVPENQVVVQVDANYDGAPVVIRCDNSEVANVWTGQILMPNGDVAAMASLQAKGETTEQLDTWRVEVNAEGRFRIENYEYSELDLFATARERPELVARVESVQPEASELVIQLSERARLAFTVLGSSGVPLASFSLRSKPASGTDHFVGVNVQERASNPWIPMPEVASVFEFSADGYFTSAELVFDPVSSGGQFAVELVPFPIVRGTVFRAGQPIAGAEVSLRREVDLDSHVEEDNLRVLWNQIYTSKSTITNEEGGFELPFHPDKARGWGSFFSGDDMRWAIEATDSSGAAVLKNIQLPRFDRSGELASELPGPFELELTSGALKGRLLLSGDRSPAGHWVGVGWGGGLFAAASVDESGAYLFEHLPPGPLFVQHLGLDGKPMGGTFGSGGDGTQPEIQSIVRAGETGVFDLDQRSDPWLVGSFLLDGQSPGAWTILLLRSDREGLASFGGMGELAGDGSFEFEPSRPGPYEVNLTGSLNGVDVEVQLPVEVLAGRCELATRIETAGLRGTWTGELETLPELTVRVDLVGGGTWTSTLPLSEAGVFELEALPQGQVFIEQDGKKHFEGKLAASGLVDLVIS